MNGISQERVITCLTGLATQAECLIRGDGSDPQSERALECSQAMACAINAVEKYDALMKSWVNALENSNSMMSCDDCKHRQYNETDGAVCGKGLKCTPEWKGATGE